MGALKSLMGADLHHIDSGQHLILPSSCHTLAQ